VTVFAVATKITYNNNDIYWINKSAIHSLQSKLLTSAVYNDVLCGLAQSLGGMDLTVLGTQVSLYQVTAIVCCLA